MSALKTPLMAFRISAKQFLHACPTAIILQQEKGAWHTRSERHQFLFCLLGASSDARRAFFFLTPHSPAQLLELKHCTLLAVLELEEQLTRLKEEELRCKAMRLQIL